MTTIYYFCCSTELIFYCIFFSLCIIGTWQLEKNKIKIKRPCWKHRVLRGLLFLLQRVSAEKASPGLTPHSWSKGICPCQTM